MRKQKKPSYVLERRCVPENTMVLRKGEPGNSAYLIQSGSVSVFTEHDGKKVEFAKLGTGQIFGEMALIFDEPRTASVKTVEECNLIVISREVFKQKLERTDPTIHAIIEMLTRRVITANNASIKQSTDVDDLAQTTRMIYQNIYLSLPKGSQGAFQNAVLPKLDDFLSSIREFQEQLSN